MSFFKNKWYNYIYNSQQIPLIIIIFACLILSSFLGYLTPKKISELFSAYEQKEIFFDIFKFLAGLFFLEYINRIIYQITVNRYIQKTLQEVRSYSFDNWIKRYEINTKDSERYPLGEVLARLMNDSDAILEMVSSGSFAIFVDVIFIVSCLISFFELNTISGAALIVFEVLICVTLVWGSKYMARVFMSVRTSSGMMSRSLANLIGGTRDLYYVPNHQYALKKSTIAFEDFLSKQLRANVWDASYYSLAESLYPILLALLIFIFPYSAITEVAIFAAIIDLIQRSIGPIKDVAGKISNIQRAKTGLDRIVSFNTDLELLPYSRMPKGDDLDVNIDEIQVNIKNFCYEQKSKSLFTLGPLELKLKKGRLLGIAGFSGSGKSTLLKILSGDLLCEQSKIEFFEQGSSRDILLPKKQEDFYRFKSIVSLVSQDSHLFSDTLAFNISFESPAAELQKFWETACFQIPYLGKWGVQLTDVIDPKKLSLGQKQLIAALRACFLRKPLVLFDEISSALDNELELALRKMILLIQRHSMTLIVAHRIETLIEADEIAIMENGKVTEVGGHGELLETSKLYQELISQLSVLS